MYVPVAGARISSDYGPRNGRGVVSSNHTGIDFAGTGPARAVVPGTVISIGWNGGYGNLVKIRQVDGTIGYYAHLARYGVRVGQSVQRGTVVGITGSTGNSTGTHLHYEVRRNGRSVNPLPWLNSNYARGRSAPFGRAGTYAGHRLSAEQLRNARTIISVGRTMGASQRDLTIALMTAYQESRLRNLNYGDRDSLGLFQQRPSSGWGSPSQVTNPLYSARKFFSALFKISGRNRMSLTGAAQAVQRSAFPNAYARWEALARGILNGSNGTGFDMGPDAEGFENQDFEDQVITPEQLDGLVPRTSSGGFPLESVLLPGVSMRERYNSDAELDVSQINDIRAQGPYNVSTNEPGIRQRMWGTEDEEPFNRSTNESELRSLLYG